MDAWQLTMDLLDGCDPDGDPALLGMTHLGAAVIQLERCDREMAQAVVIAVEGVIKDRSSQRYSS